MSNPLKPGLKSEWFPLLLILASFALGAYFLSIFPAEVAIHWNVRGEADNFGSATFAAFFLPALTAVLYLVFLFLPQLDPKREQYQQFAGTYHAFKNMLVAFLFLVYLLTSANALGRNLDVSFFMPIMVGLLFAGIGYLFRRVKTNWFFGVRTPWTMSSESVWMKTHLFSSWMMIGAGGLIVISAFLPTSAKMTLFIAAVLLVVIAPLVYSYLAYRQEKKQG